MKQIIALLLATVALLTLGNASASDRWGWSDLERPQLLPAARDDSRVPVGALGTFVENGAPTVSVVPVSLEGSAKVSGVLAAAMPQLDQAMEAMRTVVAQTPALSAKLRARGFSDDVVGLAHGRNGEVTLFVSNQV